MGIDSGILFPSSLFIITLVLGIMIGWEVAIAGGSLAALVYCFGEGSKANASPLFLWGGIIFTIVFILSAGDSLKRILERERFKARLIQLTGLCEQGHKLLLEAFNDVKSDTQKDIWWAKVERWKNNVCTIMSKIRTGDCDRWLNLDKFIPRHALFNEDMSDKVDRFSAWVEKLRGYIESRAGNEPKVD